MRTIRAERRLSVPTADDGQLCADLRALAEEILAATEVSSPSVSSPVIEPHMGIQILWQAQRLPSMKSWPANCGPVLLHHAMTPTNPYKN